MIQPPSRPSVFAVLASLTFFSTACGDRVARPPSIANTGRLLQGAVAPDPTDVGPLATTSAEYQFDAVTDPNVLADRQTEIWARVYMPADMSAGPYPMVMILHGNHETCGTGSDPRIDDNCQYTSTGTCPDGYIMGPSYLGFGYLADRLASWGYVVVSINANRGINCGDGITFDDGLVLARGRLVLKHLQTLSEWNTSGGTPASLGIELQGLLDFSQVGLIGHSRGGEGMRAAYNLYHDPGSPWPARIPDPLTIAGIFEVGPVDGESFRTLNAVDTAWNVLLPMCDGDVSDLQGVKPFDRMMRIFVETNATQKSTYTVWGANHNYYNSEWQQSESAGCTDHNPLWSGDLGSSDQQQTALFAAMAFVRANVGIGAAPTFNQNFNPQFDLPAALTAVTRVDRGYSDTADPGITRVFEDFTGVTGQSTYGFSNDSSGIIISHGGVPNHDSSQRAAMILWEAAGGYFQTNWADVGSGNDISMYQTLDVRISRQFNILNGAIDSLTDFSIQLALADGTYSAPVLLSGYTNLTGPVGGPNGLRHPILQTARVLLSDFGADLTQVRGVRLTFDQSDSGAIWVANIRLSAHSGLPQTPSGAGLPLRASFVRTGVSAPREPYAGRIEIRPLGAGPLGDTTAPSCDQIEIVVHAGDHRFRVGDSLPILRVGEHLLRSSRFGPGGDTRTIIFTASGPISGAATLENGNDRYSLGNL
jgi:hypothetical protein